MARSLFVTSFQHKRRMSQVLGCNLAAIPDHSWMCIFSLLFLVWAVNTDSSHMVVWVVKPSAGSDAWNRGPNHVVGCAGTPPYELGHPKGYEHYCLFIVRNIGKMQT